LELAAPAWTSAQIRRFQLCRAVPRLDCRPDSRDLHRRYWPARENGGGLVRSVRGCREGKMRKDMPGSCRRGTVSALCRPASVPRFGGPGLAGRALLPYSLTLLAHSLRTLQTFSGELLSRPHAVLQLPSARSRAPGSRRRDPEYSTCPSLRARIAGKGGVVHSFALHSDPLLVPGRNSGPR
jgi:hypothetical protein